MRWLLAVLSLTSCAKPFVRVSPLLEGPPRQAVMVSSMVEVEDHRDEEHYKGLVGILNLAKTVDQNTDLDNLGATVAEEIAPTLESRGLQIVIDKDRVDGLRKHDWSEDMNHFTPLTGAWTDPNGMAFRLSTDTLFRKKLYAKVAERLGTPEPDEAYVYLVTRIERRVRYLVTQYPRVRLTAIVSDDQGRELLRAKTYGDGRAKWFSYNRSQAILEPALAQAIEQMRTLPVEVIELEEQ